MFEPNSAWYYVGGLGVIGWAFLAAFVEFRTPGKSATWVAWGCAAIGVLSCLGAGVYLARIKQARDVIGFIADFKILAFIVFVCVLVGIVKLVVGFVPNDYHPWALTTGLAIFAAFLPLILHADLIPGSIGHGLRTGTDEVSQQVVAHTNGWFG